jgi:23S rRNA (cytidine1920-2'-O)/16S rRNA (cytidine1409-2'-O)-methyltransferase
MGGGCSCEKALRQEFSGKQECARFGLRKPSQFLGGNGWLTRMAKERLDVLLVQRGLCATRERAQRAIMAGRVRVGDLVVDKPGSRVPEDAVVGVQPGEKYVGRGGFKLEAALAAFGVVPEGKVCLDIGASTGGFTDCLLQQGAAKVYAVDVGHSQLDWKIRSDPRVVVMEKVNARYLSSGEVPEAPDICVVDVSFISLSLILPPAFKLLRAGGVIVALVKPQFELSREHVGRGGVVRDAVLHQRAVEKIRKFVIEDCGAAWEGLIESPILGGHGNREFLACLRGVSV